MGAATGERSELGAVPPPMVDRSASAGTSERKRRENKSNKSISINHLVIAISINSVRTPQLSNTNPYMSAIYDKTNINPV